MKSTSDGTIAPTQQAAVAEWMRKTAEGAGAGATLEAAFKQVGPGG